MGVVLHSGQLYPVEMILCVEETWEELEQLMIMILVAYEALKQWSMRAVLTELT
jgi:hypothetical protein